MNLNFQAMTSGNPEEEEEECSLDMEGYLNPNHLPSQKEKQLDTIPEDESGYLLADHLPDKVITDDESKNGICDKSVPTTNDLQNSHDSKKLESDISKEGVATNGLNHNPPCDEN